MKFKYDLTLKDDEAKKLGIILSDNFKSKRPISKDWNVFEYNGKIIMCPELIIGLPKFNWIMFPDFTWKATIIINKPLKIDMTKIEIIENFKLLNIPELNPKGALIMSNMDSLALHKINTPYILKWDKNYNDFRSFNEQKIRNKPSKPSNSTLF